MKLPGVWRRILAGRGHSTTACPRPELDHSVSDAPAFQEPRRRPVVNTAGTGDAEEPGPEAPACPGSPGLTPGMTAGSSSPNPLLRHLPRSLRLLSPGRTRHMRRQHLPFSGGDHTHGVIHYVGQVPKGKVNDIVLTAETSATSSHPFYQHTQDGIQATPSLCSAESTTRCEGWVMFCPRDVNPRDTAGCLGPGDWVPSERTGRRRLLPAGGRFEGCPGTRGSTEGVLPMPPRRGPPLRPAHSPCGCSLLGRLWSLLLTSTPQALFFFLFPEIVYLPERF